MKFEDRNKPTITRLELQEPFYRVRIDVIGPLPKTQARNKFIVAATDHLTRRGDAKTLKKKIPILSSSLFTRMLLGGMVHLNHF